MNLTIAFTLSVIMSIVFAAFNGALYGILTFIITLPIFLFVIYNLAPKKNSESSTQVTASTKAINSFSRKLFAWPELAKFRFEIDGEPQYQPILERLAARAKKIKNNDGKQSAHTAYLIPDDENKLVQVKIEDQIVGYFSISDTRSFRRRLSAKKLAGQITTCKAIVADSYKEQSRKKYYSVLLDMKPFA